MNKEQSEKKELTEEEIAELKRQQIEKELQGPHLDMVINPIRTITEIEPKKSYIIQIDPRLVNQDQFLIGLKATFDKEFPSSTIIVIPNIAFLQRPQPTGVYK